MNTLRAPYEFDLASVNVRKLICLNLALIAFMDSFVMWNDAIGGKLFTYGLKALNLLALLGLLQKSRFDKYMWVLLYLPLTWFVWEEDSIIGSFQYVFSSTLPVVSFLLLKDEEQLYVIKVYLKIIAVLFIPGLVIFFLINVVSLPHFTDTRESRSYENYFFLYYTLAHVKFRFFSVFNEPGVVGTLAAIVVFYYRKFLSKKEYILYVICGFLSLSLFFIIMFFPLLYFSDIQFISRWKKIKKVIGFTVALVIMYLGFVVVMNELKNNPLIRVAVYNRFKWENGLIVGVVSNRDEVIAGFDDAYTSMQSKGGERYWFGNGKAAVAKNFGASALSYRISLYDKGVVIMFYVAFVVLLMHPVRKNFFFSIISICFIVLVIYQRPMFYKIDYFILIFAGVRLIVSYEEKKEDSTHHPQLS